MNIRFAIFILFICYITSKSFERSKILDKINQIRKNLEERQSKKDVDVRPFPPTFNEIKGMFKSYIHLNFVDKSNSFIYFLLREKVSCLDMNMFVTNFVLQNLVEADEYELVGKLDETLKLAVDGMEQFRDKNNEGTPMFSFWRQQMGEKMYSAYPDSMVNIMKHQKYDGLIKVFEFLGMKNAADFFKMLNGLWQSFNYAYKIPADLDDTFTALGLTSFLSNKPGFEEYVGKFSNLGSLFKKVKEFAYRPFSNQINYSIDSRTYFWLHDFLMEIKNNEPERKLLLPTTWMINWGDLKNAFEDVRMPFNTNNVDLNVVGNFYYGVISTLVYFKDRNNLESALDEEFISMIKDTTDMIYWAINNDIVVKRYDLAILYYPTVWDFYWIISRSSCMIKNKLKNEVSDNFPKTKLLIDQVFVANEKIENLLRSKGTDLILSKAKSDGDKSYLVEFLGNFGGKNRNSDSEFATSLGLNTLINIWTYKNNDKLVYVEGTSDEVKQLIVRFTNYVLEVDDFLGPSNIGAFFSGSVHNNYSSWPHFYPANSYRFINGTEFPVDEPSFLLEPTMSIGIEKYISDSDFQTQKNSLHYGKKVPLEPDDLNSYAFPFWSSPAFTESLALISLSKISKLE